MVIGDRVIFKKNSKEWNYGVFFGIVNDRSYLIKDNLNHVFRRNRRFIAKTKNNALNPSEILFENHVKNSVIDNNYNYLKLNEPVIQNYQEMNNDIENGVGCAFGSDNTMKLYRIRIVL